MGMKDVRSRATKSAKPPAVAENRRLRLVAPKRCRWHGVVGVSDLAGDGIFGAFTLASLKRGVSVRAKKDSAGSMTDNATYWQMLQTAKPPASRSKTDGFALSPLDSALQALPRNA